MSQHELPIWALSARELAQHISAEPHLATEVLQHYRERSDLVHGQLNTRTIDIIGNEFKQSTALLASTDERSKGGFLPLHGVPVSIKESIDYIDTPSTAGVPSRQQHRAYKTSAMVRVLEQAGAVVLCKTNVPEMLMYLESDNPIYGCTLNPWDKTRSPGGSSGGEAAHIAAGGSVFGLGSDIGGSIRVPAHYAGIHGFKPTSHRLSLGGMVDEHMAPGQEAVIDQPGPMARHVDDLMLVMELFTQQQLSTRQDAQTPPVPLRIPANLPRGIKVGFYLDDGFFPVSSACQRVVNDAALALKAIGIEVVPFQPPAVDEAMAIYFGILAADGGRWADSWLRGDRHDHRLNKTVHIVRRSAWQRQLMAKVLCWFGQREMAAAVQRTGKVSLAQYWTLLEAQRLYIQSFRQSMHEQGIDIILCPPAATPALKHGASEYLSSVASATMLYNLLGFPAGVVAASQVRAEETKQRKPSKDWVHRAAYETDLGSEGLPVGVQVVGDVWQDGLVLRMMQVLEHHFQQQDDYPVAPWRELPF